MGESDGGDARQGAAPSGPTLLATKLHVPRPRSGSVPRERLSGRLADKLDARVTLVSAPAGFGKTSLLAEWLATADHLTVAWVALDESDSSADVFWAYVVGAVERVLGGVGGGAADELRALQPATAVAAALINDLAGDGRPLVLVLDDYHVIHSVEVHESLGYLLDHAPPALRVVIASRSDPPLPLARLRARRELLEIRAADLRFTKDEAAAYLNGAMDLGLDASAVAALEARTEGWIAALQLAGLSLQDRDDAAGFIATFAGDDRFVVDYLAEEVLDRQPDDVRAFLLQTAVLDRLTGSLCDAVTGTTGGAAMLERLDRANLFLVALDDRRRWYRYHHLFADVLRARLRTDSPAQVVELHRRASGWFAANDEPAAAVEHAMAGGHTADAARLIETAAPGMRRSRQEGTLRRWLEALPDEAFARRPVLAIGLVGARMATGDTTGCAELLDAIDAALDAPPGDSIVYDTEMYAGLPAQVAVQRAGLALLAGDPDGTAAQATRALTLIGPADHYRRAGATALLGLAHWTAGNLEGAVEDYTQAIAEFVAADHLPDMLGCSLALADIQITLGRLSDAERTFDAGLRATRDHPGLRGAADMHVGLSEILLERNQLDGAAEHLAISDALGESAGLPQHAYRWRVVTARLCRARGELGRALELIDEASPRYDTDYSPPVRPVAAIRARVLLAGGDLDGALRWAAASGLTVDDDVSYVREYSHVTLARVLIARHARCGEPTVGEAIRLLDRLLTAAGGGGRVGSAIEVLILLAAAHRAGGDSPAAVAALDDALGRAAAEGHIRLFLHAGPAIAELLRELAARRPPGDHAHSVLAAVTGGAEVAGVSPGHPPRAPGLVDPLSPRELEVLRLLRTDLSGPEIARELHVSLNTLRTHTKRIFTKLDATSRRAALRRAAELGL